MMVNSEMGLARSDILVILFYQNWKIAGELHGDARSGSRHPVPQSASFA